MRHLAPRSFFTLASFLLLSVLLKPAWAKVDVTQTMRLGNDLTPVGAEQKGNQAGTIPDWNGGITAPIAGYEHGNFHPDPYINDKIKFTIDHKNWQTHQEYLSAGQIALLKKYPSYKMHIYPSRRSAAYPKLVYEALKKNAAKAHLQKYGSGVRDTLMTSPFPIPQNGLQILWNHSLRYRGPHRSYTTVIATSHKDKAHSLISLDSQLYMAYSRPKANLKNVGNIIYYAKWKILPPIEGANTVILLHETLDQALAPRKSWVSLAGSGRVKRIPNLAYDTPDKIVDNIGTIDQFDMFNGASDVYDWQSLGKKEVYVPYNAYKVHSGNLKVSDILTNKHVQPNLLRYELHRVWVVEATLRNGRQHSLPIRRFYFDEDSWQILLADEYNQAGQLRHASESHTINYYEVPAVYSTLRTNYNLLNERYYVEGLDNELSPIDFKKKLTSEDFSSSLLRQEVKQN